MNIFLALCKQVCVSLGCRIQPSPLGTMLEEGALSVSSCFPGQSAQGPQCIFFRYTVMWREVHADSAMLNNLILHI